MVANTLNISTPFALHPETRVDSSGVDVDFSSPSAPCEASRSRKRIDTLTDNFSSRFIDEYRTLREENLALHAEILRLNENLKSSLNPISLPVFAYKNTVVRVKNEKKMTFSVRYEDGLYVTEKKTYSLYVFSRTRDGLINELCQYVVFLWNEYVKNDSSPLSIDARKLKQKLIETFEEL